ncbi:MAG TPA: hypothetical protein VF046_13305 [Gemmatimonadales bacterium]
MAWTLSLAPRVPSGDPGGGGKTARTQTVTVSGPVVGTAPAMRIARTWYAPAVLDGTGPDTNTISRAGSTAL